ncbi:MAG TPA: hypothetical protein PLZ43_15765 [bacterium]|nr:hypothetical protein [bacterium]
MPDKKKKSQKELSSEINLHVNFLVKELRQIIDEAKHNVAVTVNS